MNQMNSCSCGHHWRYHTYCSTVTQWVLPSIVLHLGSGTLWYLFDTTIWSWYRWVCLQIGDHKLSIYDHLSFLTVISFFARLNHTKSTCSKLFKHTQMISRQVFKFLNKSWSKSCCQTRPPVVAFVKAAIQPSQVGQPGGCGHCGKMGFSCNVSLKPVNWINVMTPESSRMPTSGRSLDPRDFGCHNIDVFIITLCMWQSLRF